MDDVPDTAERGEVPLACTLGPGDGPARLRRWQRLHDTAAPVAHLVGGDLEVRYRPGSGVLKELEHLAAAEQVCCSFVAWVVTETEGQPILRVIAPAEAPEAIGPIAVMFGATDTRGTRPGSHG
jgi:hypothetical protein